MPTDTTSSPRKIVKRGRYRTAKEAGDAGDLVAELLKIPEAGEAGERERAEILQLVDEALKNDVSLPSADDIRRRVKTGQSIVNRQTVGEYLTTWLAGKRDIRPATVSNYESNIRLYLVPHLGRIPLDKLRAAHVSAMFDEIDAENERIAEVRLDGSTADRQAMRYRKIVGPASKQRIRACLRSALSDAEREQLVTVNVAKHVRMPAGKRPKALVWTKERVIRWKAGRVEMEIKGAERAEALRLRQWDRGRELATEIETLRQGERPSPVMVWTAIQTGAFLDSIVQHRLYALFHLITFRGLRRGEACGLRWIDMDLDAGIATVAEQLSVVNWKVTPGEPKSDSGARDVALDIGTVAVLRNHRRSQVTDQLRWGGAWIDSGRVFVREDGSELHPSAVTDLFNELVEAAGLPPIRLHDLRHGAATLAKAAGIDTKYISEMLGHSSRKITDDTYTTVFAESALAAAEASAAMVPRARAVGDDVHGPGGLRLVSDPAVSSRSRSSKNVPPQVKG